MTPPSQEELGTFRRFDRVKKGYDPLQVDAILDRVTELLAEERTARRLLETIMAARAEVVPSLLRAPAMQEPAAEPPAGVAVHGSYDRRRDRSERSVRRRKVVTSALGTLGLLRMVPAVAAGMLTMVGLTDRLRDLEALGGSVVARPLLQGTARKVSALGSSYATGHRASTGYLVEVTRSCSSARDDRRLRRPGCIGCTYRLSPVEAAPRFLGSVRRRCDGGLRERDSGGIDSRCSHPLGRQRRPHNP